MTRIQRGRILLVLALLAVAAGSARSQVTPWDAAALMKRGINIGNTMEPETEGGWNNGPVQEYYFDDYAAEGFDCVRIPVRWDRHTGATAPYTVSAAWMDRVEQVVDWGLERGLFIIINGHHEEWLKTGYADAAKRDRYDAIWTQIANRFKNKSDRLLFEIINEPYGMTAAQVDDLNARILGIIRETNPTRIVVFSGNEWSSAARMMAAAVPDDPWLMAYFHSYDPWSFAGEANGLWGSTGDRATLASMFQGVAAWSASKDVPVMISEFGAVGDYEGRTNDFNSRMAHYAAYVDNALANGIAFQAWDDGGWFGIYDRPNRRWNEIKDILVKSYPDGPGLMTSQVHGDSLIVLSWTNRAATYESVRVQKVNLFGQFETVATLPGDATSFGDTDVAAERTYTYRVIADESGHAERVGYPYRVTVALFQREGYHGGPLPIPGSIEAEDFDWGGEGLTYHDLDGENVGGEYRPDEGVDIEARDDGGFQVARAESGEWMEYAVDVQEAGSYDITAHVASVDGGGTFRFDFGAARTSLYLAPKTGSDQTTAPITRSVTLDAGEQIMRLSILNGTRPFAVDRFDIQATGSTGVDELPDAFAAELFPNPSRTGITLRLARAPVPSARAEIVSVLGRVVRRVDLTGPETRIETDGLAAGLYVVRILEPRAPEVRRTVVLL